MKISIKAFVLSVFLFGIQQMHALPEGESISGIVRHAATGEPLIGANVLINELNRGIATNRHGTFIFRNIPHGSYTLVVRFVGFARFETSVEVPADFDEPLEIALYEKTFEVDEIIVTASPIGSPVRYQAQQSLQGEELQRRVAASIGEMLEREAGLAMRSFGSAPARPVIRGLDGDRVLVLENGERMGDLAETAHDHAVAIDPLAANRIEIVRGPASLLYGSSALGGVVNIFSDDIPHSWTPGWSGNAALFGSSMNNGAAGYTRVVYGGADRAAAFRLSHREAGNIRTPEGVLPGTSLRNTSAAAGFITNGAGSNVGAAVTYIDKEYGLPDDIDDPDTEIDLIMERLTVQGRGEWRVDGFLKNVELRLNGARYAHQEIESVRQGDTIDRDIELDFLQYSVSNTLTLVHNPFLIFSEGAIGMSILYRDMSVGGIEALSPDGRSIAMGFFIYEEIPLTDYLRLQFGSRMEAHRITARANEKFPEAGSSRESTTISGSAGFNYRPHYRFEVGLQAARAHRTPALEELYSDAAHLGTGAYEIGNPGLRNEIGHGVDIFGKYTANAVQFEAAGFYNRISDFIFLEPAGAVHMESGLPIFRYVASDASLYGGEAGIAAVIPVGGVSETISGVEPTGSRRYSIRTDIQASYVRGTQMSSERVPLPFMPPLRGRLGMILDAGRWWAGGSVYWSSAQNRVAPDEDRTDAYALVNGEAGYRLHYSGRHVLSVRMDNIFNTVYRDHLSRVQDRGNPMPGRNVNAVYRWYF